MKTICMFILMLFILSSCSILPKDSNQEQKDNIQTDNSETLSDSLNYDDITDSSMVDQRDEYAEDISAENNDPPMIVVDISPLYFYSDSLPEYYLFAVFNAGDTDYHGNNQYLVEYYNGTSWVAVASSEAEYAEITVKAGGDYVFRNIKMNSTSDDEYQYVPGLYRINYNGIAYCEFSVKDRQATPELKVEVTPTNISLNSMPDYVNVKIINTGDTVYVGSRHCSVDYYNGSEWITVVAPVVPDEQISIEPAGFVTFKIDLFSDIVSEDYAYLEGQYRVNYNKTSYGALQIYTPET